MTAAAVVWAELPRWYEPELRAYAQAVQAAHDDAVQALASAERERAAHALRLRNISRERLDQVRAMAKAQKRHQIGRTAVAACELKAQRLQASLPTDDTSALYASRYAEWQRRGQSCARMLVVVDGALAAAEQDSRVAAAALDQDAIQIEQADATAQRGMAQAQARVASLQARRESCMLQGSRCEFTRAVALDIIPAWVQAVAPLLAALLVGTPLVLRSVHPREAAARRRRDEARFEALLVKRREDMLQAAA